jgi:hypothetical protein
VEVGMEFSSNTLEDVHDSMDKESLEGAPS